MLARHKKALLAVALCGAAWAFSYGRRTPGQPLELSVAPLVAQTADPGRPVGETTITARELDRRMKEMPRNVLETMGSTPAEIRRAYLDQVLVPAALFAEEAKAKGLAQRRDVRDRVLGVLRLALVRDLKKEAGADKVSDEDVRAFYKANADKFSVPKRLSIYRILLGSEGEANALLKELGATPDPKAWNDVARDKSLDKATRLRGGNLGMVGEDGTTGQAGEKVDVAVYAAADAVKDGELVPRPVKEGDKWAVVWKRQSAKASVRPLELEADNIKASIADERLKKVTQDLVTRLRTEYLTEQNPELCDMVSVTALQAQRVAGADGRSGRASVVRPPIGSALLLRGRAASLCGLSRRRDVRAWGRWGRQGPRSAPRR
jgi:peptidyl-prolyl cis-trans isomerase C